jgi:hypothetical protein
MKNSLKIAADIITVAFDEIKCSLMHTFSIFSTTCPKAKFRKKIIFIQTNSFTTFICLNWVLLVTGFLQVG